MRFWLVEKSQGATWAGKNKKKGRDSCYHGNWTERRFDRRGAFMSSGMYRAGKAQQNIDTARSPFTCSSVPPRWLQIPRRTVLLINRYCLPDSLPDSTNLLDSDHEVGRWWPSIQNFDEPLTQTSLFIYFPDIFFFSSDGHTPVNSSGLTCDNCGARTSDWLLVQAVVAATE